MTQYFAGTNNPTKRAPDAGDSTAISGSVPRLIIFLAGRLRRPAPAQVTQAVGHFLLSHNSGLHSYVIRLR